MKKIVTGALCTCFLTAVSAQTTILSEDFESGIPSTWAIVINDTSTVDTTVAEFAPGWITLEDPDNDQNMIAGATSFFTVPARADRWLILPKLTLGAYGNFISWSARSHDPSFLDGYYVLASATDSLTASFTDTIGTHGMWDPFWTNHEIDLSAEGYNNQQIYIAFVLRSYDQFKLYLDSVNVRKDDPLSVNEASMINVELYPNPAAESFTVKGDKVEAVRIYSMNGQLILEQKTTSGQPVSVAQLQVGAYIVETITAAGIARKRLIKK